MGKIDFETMELSDILKETISGIVYHEDVKLYSFNNNWQVSKDLLIVAMKNLFFKEVTEEIMSVVEVHTDYTQLKALVYAEVETLTSYFNRKETIEYIITEHKNGILEEDINFYNNYEPQSVIDDIDSTPIDMVELGEILKYKIS